MSVLTFAFFCSWIRGHRHSSPECRHTAVPTHGTRGWYDLRLWELIWFASRPAVRRTSLTPYTWAEKLESFERINSLRETNGNFDSSNSGTSRVHELHESKFPFVSRIEFIRSKLSNFSAHVYGVGDCAGAQPRSDRRQLAGKPWQDETLSLPELGAVYRWHCSLDQSINRCIRELSTKWLFWFHARHTNLKWKPTHT